MYNPFSLYVILQSRPTSSCHLSTAPSLCLLSLPVCCSTALQHFALSRHMLSNGLYPFCIHNAISWNNLCVPSPRVGTVPLSYFWTGWLSASDSESYLKWMIDACRQWLFCEPGGRGWCFLKGTRWCGMIWIYKGPWGCFRYPLQCESDDALSLRAQYPSSRVLAHSSEHKSLCFAYCASIQKINLALYCRYLDVNLFYKVVGIVAPIVEIWRVDCRWGDFDLRKRKAELMNIN